MLTQSEAMQQFLQKMKPLFGGDFTPQYKSVDEAYEDCFSLLEPFIANPQRHKEAVKALVEGFGAQAALVQLRDVMKLAMILRRLGFPKHVASLEAVQRIESIRDGLLESVHPGDFDLDILPPREKPEAIDGRRLIVFQLNVAVYPLPDFPPDSLSIRLTAADDEIQFEDVNPASRIDAVGSYEVGVTEGGKFTETSKNAEKLAFKLDGQVAKIDGEIGAETSQAWERSNQVSLKQTAPTHAPLVISSALRNVARWELLRAPNQMLTGGSRFLATAFVPRDLKIVTLNVIMRVELRNYGLHEISASKQIRL